MREHSAQTSQFDRDRLQIVVTGFGPFLQYEDNPSWGVARACAAELEAHFSVRAVEIPVIHRRAEQFAKSLDWGGGQIFGLHFGLAADRSHVSLERYAHNRRGATPDESSGDPNTDASRPGLDTNLDPDTYLDPEGPLARQTLVGVDELAERFVDVDVDVRVSRDVGEYVCNTLYYHALAGVERARRASTAAEALFVHIPSFSPAQATLFGQNFARRFYAHLDAHL